MLRVIRLAAQSDGGCEQVNVHAPLHVYLSSAAGAAM